MIERTFIEKANSNPNFIGSWLMQASLCDDLVSYFERHKNQHKQGSTSSGENVNNKDRIDISLSPNEIKLAGNEIFEIYFKSLFEFYKDYNLQWPFLEYFASDLNIGGFNMGRYEKGQHFQSIHCERCGLNTLHRLFAFMTYLNDVEEGGSTYFEHYDLEIKPRKGLTILWPAEWTHIHKGNVIKKGSKYIITGWINFPS